MAEPEDTETLAVDAVFAAFGKAATYTPPGGGAATACTVIKDARDREPSGFSGRPILQGTVIEVRKSEIAAPAKGGAFVVGAENLVIKSDPEAEDPDRLVWTCTVK